MASLDRLTVRGFKSIRSLEDFEPRNLNVLVGANGAGKSNLLSLFRMLEHLLTERLQLFIKREGGAEVLLFGGRRRTPEASVALRFDGGRYKYEFSLSPVAGDALAFAREYVFPINDVEWLNDPHLRSFPVVQGPREWSGHDEARLAKCRAGGFVSHVRSEMHEWRVFHFQDVSRVAQVRLASGVRDNRRLKPDAGNLAPFLRVLNDRHPDQYRRIVETVRLAAPFFGDFVHREEVDEKMELEWFQASEPDTVLGPLQFSDGTLRFICLATLLLQPSALQPSVLVIDEPELGLHPHALVLLAEMLQHASHKRQVIVSTQSADLVSELDPADVVVVERHDGASTFRRLDPDSLKDWLEEYSLGDLFRMNVVGGGPAR